MAVRDSQMGDMHAAYMPTQSEKHQAYEGRYENSSQLKYRSVSVVCQQTLNFPDIEQSFIDVLQAQQKVPVMTVHLKFI